MPAGIPAGVTAQRHSRSWAGYAAFAWAAVFALMSLYWAVGGLVGGETLGVEIDRLARERDGSFVASLWVAFALKAVAAALALALVLPWDRRLPWRPLLVLGWATGVGITVYAVANLVQHALMATDAISTPDSLGTSAVRWHLGLWDPFWLIGGLLFLAATRAFQRSSGGESPHHGGRRARSGSAYRAWP
jgi:Protein of unknown function (DUF3995)